MLLEKPLSADRCKIIISLADNKMNIAEVSRQLYMHRSTVAYHIERIKQITGKDPLDFYDLYNLVLLAKAETSRKRLKKDNYTPKITDQTFYAINQMGAKAHGG